jgi:hypothetical protein
LFFGTEKLIESDRFQVQSGGVIVNSGCSFLLRKKRMWLNLCGLRKSWVCFLKKMGKKVGVRWFRVGNAAYRNVCCAVEARCGYFVTKLYNVSHFARSASATLIRANFFLSSIK